MGESIDRVNLLYSISWTGSPRSRSATFYRTSNSGRAPPWPPESGPGAEFYRASLRPANMWRHSAV